MRIARNMHEIRKVAYAAAGPTITIVDMNRCILRACDVFLVGLCRLRAMRFWPKCIYRAMDFRPKCIYRAIGVLRIARNVVLAKMHIPRYGLLCVLRAMRI